MPATDRLQLARDVYGASVSGDRRIVEDLLSEDYAFYSPADVGIDCERYFERCWPNAELIEDFHFTRLIENGDEVIVTYESAKTDGAGFVTPRSSRSAARSSARPRSTSAGTCREGRPTLDLSAAERRAAAIDLLSWMKWAETPADRRWPRSSLSS
jgi:hypothetical protein